MTANDIKVGQVWVWVANKDISLTIIDIFDGYITWKRNDTNEVVNRLTSVNSLLVGYDNGHCCQLGDFVKTIYKMDTFKFI
jgi:hypothetical protein